MLNACARIGLGEDIVYEPDFGGVVGDAAIIAGLPGACRLMVVVKTSQTHCYTLRPEPDAAAAAAFAGDGGSSSQWRAEAAVAWAEAWRRYAPHTWHDIDEAESKSGATASSMVAARETEMQLLAALAPRMVGHSEQALAVLLRSSNGYCSRILERFLWETAMSAPLHHASVRLRVLRHVEAATEAHPQIQNAGGAGGGSGTASLAEWLREGFDLAGYQVRHFQPPRSRSLVRSVPPSGGGGGQRQQRSGLGGFGRRPRGSSLGRRR